MPANNFDYAPYQMTSTVPFVLKSLYNMGGENIIHTMVSTNIDLDKLLTSDLRAFLYFFQEHLAEHIDCGNYDRDPNICQVFDVQRNDQSFDDFIAEVVDYAEANNLTESLDKENILIVVNQNTPTSLLGFVQEEIVNASALSRYLKSKTVMIIL